MGIRAFGKFRFILAALPIVLSGCVNVNDSPNLLGKASAFGLREPDLNGLSIPVPTSPSPVSGLYRSECMRIENDNPATLASSQISVQLLPERLAVATNHFKNASCEGDSTSQVQTVYEGRIRIESGGKFVPGEIHYFFDGGVLGSTYYRHDEGSICVNSELAKSAVPVFFGESACLSSLRLQPGPRFFLLSLSSDKSVLQVANLDSQTKNLKPSARAESLDLASRFERVRALDDRDLESPNQAEKIIVDSRYKDFRCEITVCPNPGAGCFYSPPKKDQNGCAIGCGERICSKPPVEKRCEIPSCPRPPEGCKAGLVQRDSDGCQVGCGGLVCK